MFQFLQIFQQTLNRWACKWARSLGFQNVALTVQDKIHMHLEAQTSERLW